MKSCCLCRTWGIETISVKAEFDKRLQPVFQIPEARTEAEASLSPKKVSVRFSKGGFSFVKGKRENVTEAMTTLQSWLFKLKETDPILWKKIPEDTQSYVSTNEKCAETLTENDEVSSHHSEHNNRGSLLTSNVALPNDYRRKSFSVETPTEPHGTPQDLWKRDIEKGTEMGVGGGSSHHMTDYRPNWTEAGTQTEPHETSEDLWKRDIEKGTEMGVGGGSSHHMTDYRPNWTEAGTQTEPHETPQDLWKRGIEKGTEMGVGGGSSHHMTDYRPNWTEAGTQTEPHETSEDPSKHGSEKPVVQQMSPQDGNRDDDWDCELLDIEDHVWNYLQSKRPDIERILSEEFACKIKLRVVRKTGEHQSHLCILCSSSSTLTKVTDKLVDLYREAFNLNLLCFSLKLPDNITEERLKRRLEGSEAVLFRGPNGHQIIGPRLRVEEIKRAIEEIPLKPTDIGAASLLTEEKECKNDFTFRTGSGLRVCIRKGDITKQPVEAIVNAANVHLDHGSGVAGSIRKAGGKQLERECDDHIKKNGKLRVSHPMHTSAGDIQPPIKWVIHVAGPIAREYQDKQKLLQVLTDTFENVLIYANDELRVRSVAIPAISSGVYGVYKEQVASCAFEALSIYEVRRLSDEKSQRFLTDVYFVDIDENTTQTFVKVFQSSLPSKPNGATGQSSDVNDNPRHQAAKFDGDDDSSCRRNNGGGVAVQTEDNGSGRQARSERQEGNQEYAAAVKNDDDDISPTKPKAQPHRVRQLKPDSCVICLDLINNTKKLDCGHSFCTECIDEYFAKCQPKCPSCGKLFGTLKGNQPKGNFFSTSKFYSLPGYLKCGTIEIEYNIPDGIQTEEHPNPGKPFKGTRRTCYLPDIDEGRQVRDLLKKAFDNGLIFTIGQSTTTGKDNVVVWNDIHHKTKTTGEHGYPDDTYLKRVKEELAAKGIVP